MASINDEQKSTAPSPVPQGSGGMWARASQWVNVHRQLLFFEIGVTALFAAGMILIWQYASKQEIEEFIREAQDVKRQIAITEWRLERLSERSPEEEQRIEEQRETLVAQEVTEDVKLEGVEIIEKDDKKIIKNHSYGYYIEMPGRLVIARSISGDSIELHDPQYMCEGDPSCEPVLRIRTEASNPNQLSLEEWFAAEEQKSGFPLYSPREKIELGSQAAYRVTEIIPDVFEGFYYYWSRVDKIYYIRVADIDDETYRPYIETFRFEEE
ncbi:MAG: hypothetical protein A2939_01765 [Parcubacteria group bacterium RIFCSPLOWO2_01_FULL_48_18]|nr:MAG: hypothetical protein A2939_01765 [Parcubacteria group bacterium RIFCSPLOWO2_01_FULL_48_18]OHB23350.1 MAG: hypothetical protein A3J67_00595 [Parcubacteria group bacterium RIFCSPHIGHO2_02_FULL_48_10b]